MTFEYYLDINKLMGFIFHNIEDNDGFLYNIKSLNIFDLPSTEFKNKLHELILESSINKYLYTNNLKHLKSLIDDLELIKEEIILRDV